MDLPRPEVTVTDPRQPGTFVPVEEPAPPRLGRRGAALLAVAAVVGAAALLATDVARDRREAVEQRRLDGVVDLALGAPGGGWSASHDPRTGTGTVEGTVRMVNEGPRDVRVTSVELGGVPYDADSVVEAGEGTTPVVLQRTVRCPRDGGPPPREPEPADVRVHLETPGGAREVQLGGDGLPFGSVDDGVQAACAHPPLRQSVSLTGSVVRAEASEVVLRVEVANRGRRPLRLLSLVPARGLVVRSVAGDASVLPLVLPVPPGRSPVVRTLEVRLGVICGALLGADLLRPFEEVSAIVEDEGLEQITSVEALARDPDLELRQLARRTCSSG